MSNKQIGQFFSGKRVSDLLASMLDIDSDHLSVIDPMAGTGDLLAAVNRRGVDTDNLFAVDIDSAACLKCMSFIPEAHVLASDAFSLKALDFYRLHEWDIVITNPPYIRRETIRNMYEDNSAGERVREKLLELIAQLDAGSEFIAAANSYSGLSDLAVPSWILCAALVRPEGTLAMVVPEAWLTRKYAQPIRDLLSNEFDVEYLVKDASRSWFSPAQVKTNLLIAKRKHTSGTFRCIELTNSVASEGSLVEKLSYNGANGYDAFNDIRNDDLMIRSKGLFAITMPTAHLNGFDPARFLKDTFGPNSLRASSSLNEWGVGIGQGLRTGSNDFFYLSETATGMFASPIMSKLGQNISFPDVNDMLVPALRRQSDLDGGFLVNEALLQNRLLLINENIDSIQIDDSIKKALRETIEYAERNPFPVKGELKLIPMMSAVKTNGGLSTDSSSRKWYMLPKLKARHIPDLAVPRLVGGKIQTIMMPAGHRIAVDANFSTLCLDLSTSTSVYGILALMNSSIVRLQLECICTVMGGGALKIEARDLMRLHLPKPNSRLSSRLNKIGLMLAKCTDDKKEREIQKRLDLVVMNELIDERFCPDAAGAIQKELSFRLSLRGA